MMKQGVDHGFPLGFEKTSVKNKRQAEKTSDKRNNKRKSRSKESRAVKWFFLQQICTLATEP